MSKESHFLFLSRLIFLLISVYFAVVLLRIGTDEPRPLFFNSYVAEGACVLFCLMVGLLCRGIASKKPSNYFPYHSIVLWYIYILGLEFMMKRAYKSFIKISKDPMKAQEKWLLKFLADRKDTAMGRDWGFRDIKSIADFRRRLPVTSYDQYKEYMERVAKGEANVMNKGKPEYIILTSGTTGDNKKYFFNKAMMYSMLPGAFFLPTQFSKKDFPLRLRMPLTTAIIPQITKSESGCPMGAFSGFFKKVDCTTPSAVIQGISDENTLMYVHAVFGLLHDDIFVANFSFVALARSFFLTLETKWKDIVEDIRLGTMNADLDIRQDVRKIIQKKMWANPGRADELKKEFEKGFDNILPRVWKEVNEVIMLSSGSLLAPSLTLKKKYFPQIPLVSTVHGGSEGMYGACLEKGKVPAHYTLIPQDCFYEFIPMEEISDLHPSPKLMDELKVGEQYALCLTTDRGVFRYRIGDVIKVVSNFNKIPQYELIGRHGVILDICTEKTTETALTSAVEKTMSRLNDFALVDFTSAESSNVQTETETAGSDRHYILFIELETRTPEAPSLTEEQKNMFDEDLQEFNEYYKSLRGQGRIQRMKVIQMKPGSFVSLKHQTLEMNSKSSSAQFKTPRVLRKECQLTLMTDPNNVLTAAADDEKSAKN